MCVLDFKLFVCLTLGLQLRRPLKSCRAYFFGGSKQKSAETNKSKCGDLEIIKNWVFEGKKVHRGEQMDASNFEQSK